MENIMLWAAFFVICLFSFLQSIFGVGLLVFGTPILVVIGFEFLDALGVLIPSSLAISAVQLIGSKEQKKISKNLYYVTLPATFVGLYIVSSFVLSRNLLMMMSLVLFLAALLRVLPRAKTIMKTLMSRHSIIAHLFLGLVHGFTNLGGALLTLLATGNSNNKEQIRYETAFYYFCFVIIQLLALSASEMPLTIIYGFAFSPFAAIVYFSIGNSIFKVISDALFDVLITCLLFSLSAVLFFRWAGV